MQFTQNLDTKQSQSLRMSPQLQQAIKLLQMTNIELQEYLSTQFNDNPLIDVIAPEQMNPTQRNNEKNVETEHVSKEIEHICDNNFSDCVNDSPSSVSETEFQNIGNYKNYNGGETIDENTNYSLQNELNLRDHLSSQLYMSKAPQDILLISSYLIGLLSDTGYLHETCLEISGQLMQPVEKVEEALKLCQQFEPVGVFARNLSECLRLQLIDKKIYNKQYELILNNLDLLANNKYNILLKKLGIDKESLLEYITQIKRLYPKPGLQYSNEPIMPIIADVFITETNDGAWQVTLNNSSMPKAIINQTYSVYLKKNSQNNTLEKYTKRYLKEAYHQASWVIKSLEKRSDTILRVATEILRQQDGFFAYGFEHLNPMNLKIVAEELDLHESTISRVTAGKYLKCARGTFEMKFFFMSGISGEDGETVVASQKIKHDIKKIIENEDPKNILSDGHIADILLDTKQIKIARRTVAKYREMLKIPSSVKRRVEKNSFF